MTRAPYEGWIWPLELRPGVDARKPVVSDGFKAQATASTRQHLGIDIMYKRAARGTPDLPGVTAWFECVDARVLAAFDGNVWKVHRTDPHGISLELDHHNVPGVGPRVTVYRHLAVCYVADGQAVKAGDVLGIAGYDTTRKATETPNHLHFELWDTSRPKTTGNPREDFGLDPALVMGAWGFKGRLGQYTGPDGKVLVAAAGAMHGGEEPTFTSAAAFGVEAGLLG